MEDNYPDSYSLSRSSLPVKTQIQKVMFFYPCSSPETETKATKILNQFSYRIQETLSENFSKAETFY
jgi:hypothetical protein